MTRRNRALFLLCLFCFGQTAVFGESKPLELKWTELAPMIVGQAVELTLADGGKVSGEAVAVRDDAMVVDVKKSSGPKQYSKGSGPIPRESIRALTLWRHRGTWGRSLGTTLGVITGLGTGGYAAAHTSSGGGAVAVVLAVTGTIAVAGYYAGKGLDRRTTRISIVP